MSEITTNNFFTDIKNILAEARKKSYTAINTVMLEAYWKIGERIVLQEQNGKDRATYGESILKELSQALTQEFGKGFSYANLRNFRQFYLTYRDNQICYTLCSKLTWSHNRLIMRVENADARTNEQIVQQLVGQYYKEYPIANAVRSLLNWFQYRMKQFYEAYNDSTIVSPLVTQISWYRLFCSIFTIRHAVCAEFAKGGNV